VYAYQYAPSAPGAAAPEPVTLVEFASPFQGSLDPGEACGPAATSTTSTTSPSTSAPSNVDESTLGAAEPVDGNPTYTG